MSFSTKVQAADSDRYLILITTELGCWKKFYSGMTIVRGNLQVEGRRFEPVSPSFVVDGEELACLSRCFGKLVQVN